MKDWGNKVATVCCRYPSSSPVLISGPVFTVTHSSSGFKALPANSFLVPRYHRSAHTWYASAFATVSKSTTIYSLSVGSQARYICQVRAAYISSRFFQSLSSGFCRDKLTHRRCISRYRSSSRLWSALRIYKLYSIVY